MVGAIAYRLTEGGKAGGWRGRKLGGWEVDNDNMKL